MVPSLFQKVLISVPKVSNLGRFKKEFKKMKTFKIKAEILKGLVLFGLLFPLNNRCM